MLKLLPFREQDIPAFVALDAAAMGHLGLARAMSFSMPPDGPSRQEMIEEWTRKGFAKREETDSVYLKIVDTGLPAKDGASGEGEIISAAIWAFSDSKEESAKTDKAQASDEGEEQSKKQNGPAETVVGVEMRRTWDQLKRDYFPHQSFANLNVLVTHPNHQRRGAGSMLVKWGTDEADKRGIISVLVATQMGLGCYLKNGFEVVRENEINLTPFGVDEVEIRRGMIRRPQLLA